MESKTALRGTYSTDYLNSHSNPSPFEQTAPEATLPLTRGLSLISILLISLRLWASIWVAVAAFAAARLL